MEGTSQTHEDRRNQLRIERSLVASHHGGTEPRIVVEFLLSAAAWVTILVLGTLGIIPLWMGLVANTVIATTFYMPMHEAAHGNILGRRAGSRWLEEVIGVLCSIPLGFCFSAHRVSHMRHHAHTNDPLLDPDHFTDGPLRMVLIGWLGQVMVLSLLPVFALIPASRRLIPVQMRRTLGSGDRREGLRQLRYWLFTTLVLVVAFVLGLGWPALLLWYLPSRLQALWLLFIFAWYPHHPASEVGRYVDTRVAVFPGSGLLIRGHDHHAVHHLFPRIPHYRLRRAWQDIAEDMVSKGVRSEGRATAATRPIVW